MATNLFWYYVLLSCEQAVSLLYGLMFYNWYLLHALKERKSVGKVLPQTELVNLN